MAVSYLIQKFHKSVTVVIVTDIVTFGVATSQLGPTLAHLTFRYHTQLRACARAHTHTHIHRRIHTLTKTIARAHTHTHTHTHIHSLTHTLTHTFTHIHTHTHTPTSISPAV